MSQYRVVQGAQEEGWPEGPEVKHLARIKPIHEHVCRFHKPIHTYRRNASYQWPTDRLGGGQRVKLIVLVPNRRFFELTKNSVYDFCCYALCGPQVGSRNPKHSHKHSQVLMISVVKRLVRQANPIRINKFSSLAWRTPPPSKMSWWWGATVNIDLADRLQRRWFASNYIM